MEKFIKIKLPKKQLAYTLSAAILISLTPATSHAAEYNDIPLYSAGTTGQEIIQTNTITGSAVAPGTDQTDPSVTPTGGSVIPDNVLSGTSTGGSLLPDNTPSEAVTGGTTAPDESNPPESTPPATGGNPVWTGPGNIIIPDIPPVTDGSQTVTITGGAVTPDNSQAGTSTGGAVTPGNTQTTTPDASAPAIGTKITVGNYIYQITSNNTVVLKGFAKDVSLATVIARNQITYKKVTYKVTKVGASAFKGQTGIKKVIIRKNITDVASNSFYNCTNITKVTIRAGVTIIRKQAFMGCSKLKTVNITSPVLSQVKKNAFKNIKNGAVINVVNRKAKLAVKASIPAGITINQM